MNRKLLFPTIIIGIGAICFYFWNSAGLKVDNKVSVIDSKESQEKKPVDVIKDTTEDKSPADQGANPPTGQTGQSEKNPGDTSVTDGQNQTGTEKKQETLPPEEVQRKIVEYYNGKFLVLKAESTSKLDALIKQAKDELSSASSDNKSPSKLSLGMKYLELGKSLENECDAQFYSILSEMKQELTKNDLPLDAANDAEKLYKAEKSQRRSYLLSKAFK